MRPTGQVAAPIKPYENRRGAFAHTGRRSAQIRSRLCLLPAQLALVGLVLAWVAVPGLALLVASYLARVGLAWR